jgi:hypothetical protein
MIWARSNLELTGGGDMFEKDYEFEFNQYLQALNPKLMSTSRLKLFMYSLTMMMKTTNLLAMIYIVKRVMSW